MYLITAYFDEKSSKNIQRMIRMVADRTGNTFMIDHEVPPHLTISSIEARDVDILTPSFLMLDGKLNKGTIRFVSPGQLLPYVFYITPVLNDYLQNLSNSVYEQMKDIEETTISRFYQPGSWLPHTTIGKTLDKEQMREAFAVMQDGFAPFDAEIIELGLSRVNPHRDIHRIPLI